MTPGLALRKCRGAPGLGDCPELIPAATPDHRCARCRRLASAGKAQRNRETGRNLSAVRRSMAEAVRRRGRCARCGATPDHRRLTAHLPGGGVHVADWTAYRVLCEPCHRLVEAEEAGAP